MESKPTEMYDLLIVVDATASMGNYLDSLRHSLPQVISISVLTNCFDRIGLIAYRDYCDGDSLLEWSGWSEPNEDNHSTKLLDVARRLEALGGGDWPEATKTALAKAYDVMHEDATTLMLLYTDAPPHMLENGSSGRRRRSNLPNGLIEREALSKKGVYGGHGPAFIDWVSAANTLAGRAGGKKAQVMCFSDQINDGLYHYLATRTGGAFISLHNTEPTSISQITTEVLLAWMGAEKSGADSVSLPGNMERYVQIHGIKQLKDEEDAAVSAFFARPAKSSFSQNITRVDLSSEILKKYLPKKTTPVEDFARRYVKDEPYRNLVTRHLRQIIEDDVVTISLNPVFGSLWRAFCNDRSNHSREELISNFGLQIERLESKDEKERMKAWLEESYDYTAEVSEAIESVPPERRFPCVFLDPTLAFERAPEDGTEDEDGDDRPITQFRRDELLEIGRSCDYRILRRLGRVLTRLTYVSSAEEMPAHVASASDEEVPKIPMALASKQYGNKFWRILLHIVVPGTMLSARPATLLAALSLKLGVQPLFDIAAAAMKFWKGKWNDLEIPETWNVGCLSLLLDADRAYRSRMEESGQVCAIATSPGRENDSGRSNKRRKVEANGLLKETDRKLFERLADYKMLELNLNTALTAKAAWAPDKTTMPIGPVTVCRDCKYPRSVTIMGERQMCGVCLANDFETEEDRNLSIKKRVSSDDNETSPAVWVECSARTCRAQYVVYDVERLNVKPKCHYCRMQGAVSKADRAPSPAPVVECTRCLNRMIWPDAYRPSDLDKAAWTCIACSNGRTTIVDVETTASKLSSETDQAWLLRNDDGKLEEPFNGRSLFHTISTAGADGFAEKVHLFPQPNPTLTIRGKLVRNAPDLISQLTSWVSSRRAEAATCSLCFSTSRKASVLPACGRSGCIQRICRSCLNAWYGLNSPGRIINTAAMSCPFCRRAPTARTLARYGMGIHAVGGLRQAVEEQGAWIFAWCNSCGFAKRYVERVCAAGAPAELRNWACDECREWEAEEWADDIDLDDADGAAAREPGHNRERKRGKPPRRRKCPGCGVVTEKVGGCDHISCPCGTHWCFFCGKGAEEVAIYEHMAMAHGGWYGEDEPENETE